MDVTENVAYDVTGYCYYLEAGVEEDNTVSFNLAAHIHAINPDSDPPGGGGQSTGVFVESDRLTLPADVSASGFYITNVHNNIVGNAASGGWAGFNFPNLQTGVDSVFKEAVFRPSSATGLQLDGNTAHSTGWWWGHAGAFYIGGALYYKSDGRLEYNPGRNSQNFDRCAINACEDNDNCRCPDEDKQFLNMTNSKAFLTSGVGFNSWSGTMNVEGWESHDTGLSIESLSGGGFWITNMLAVCRTGEELARPEGSATKSWTRIPADGFTWYDTGQEHIITRATFRNCGFRSDVYAQYDQSPDRGCDENDLNGCQSRSSAFRFLTHSDQFTPELMQGTKDITFDNCGRRFSLDNWQDNRDTVSGRQQNWLDVDGSASGLGETTLIVSGSESAATWWQVDDNVVYDPQGPLRFIPQKPTAETPARGLGHVTIYWDDALHDQVGSTICGNGDPDLQCEAHGYLRHAGKKFSGTQGIALTPRKFFVLYPCYH